VAGFPRGKEKNKTKGGKNMKLSNTYLCCNCDELLVPKNTNNFCCSKCNSSQVYPISKWLPSIVKDKIEREGEEEEDELNLNNKINAEICQSIRQINICKKRIVLLDKLRNIKDSIKELKNYRYSLYVDIHKDYIRVYFKHVNCYENSYDNNDDIIEWAFNNNIPIYQHTDVYGTYIRTLQIKPSKLNMDFDKDIVLIFHVSENLPSEYKKVQKTMTYSTIVCEKEY